MRSCLGGKPPASAADAPDPPKGATQAEAPLLEGTVAICGCGTSTKHLSHKSLYLYLAWRQCASENEMRTHTTSSVPWGPSPVCARQKSRATLHLKLACGEQGGLAARRRTWRSMQRGGASRGAPRPLRQLQPTPAVHLLRHLVLPKQQPGSFMPFRQGVLACTGAASPTFTSARMRSLMSNLHALGHVASAHLMLVIMQVAAGADPHREEPGRAVHARWAASWARLIPPPGGHAGACWLIAGSPT